MRKTASGKTKRSFTLTAVKHVDGCATKFHPGEYMGSNPHQAASKAFTRLCNLKGIKGACTLVLTVRETTREATTKKEFTYHARRVKLDEPVMLPNGGMREYINKLLKSKSTPTCKKSRKSSGPMRKTSRRSKKSSKK